MTPAKVRIAVAFFAYGGNGGVSSIIPELAVWWGKSYHRLVTDPRVESVITGIYSDTPVYMTRNLAVKEAVEAGCDMLLMLDSDNEPDAYYMKDLSAKLFLDEPFTFAYDRLMRGIPTVIAAPYCGPPPSPINRPGISDGGEVPYLFQWTNIETNGLDSGWKQEMLSRREAERLAGIHPMSSLPTGVCLFTTNVFNGPPKPYFDYEHDKDKTEKRGTEDCFGTRNLSVYWKIKRNYDVCHAACDSWAVHNKPKRVGKPRVATLEMVSEEMREAVTTKHSSNDELRIVDHSTKLPRRGQVLGPDDDCVVITEEEMEQARVLVEREQATGSDIADIRLPEEGREVIQRLAHVEKQAPPPRKATEEVEAERVAITERVETITTAVEEAFADPDYVKGNGQALRHKMVAYRKVAILDREIADDDLEHIGMLTSWLATRKDGCLDVAAVHPGTGQSASAIFNSLPEGSHLHAYDSVMTYQFSPEHANQFVTSFQPELEDGSVLAEVSSRRFPWPADHESFDMVFIERAVDKKKLGRWLDYVAPGGILAGVGESLELAKTFADAQALSFRNNGNVWVIANGG